MEVEGAEEVRDGGRGPLHQRVREPEDADRQLLELGVAVDAREAEEHEGRHRVPGGGRMVVELLAARHEPVALGRVDVEAAAVGIGEELDEQPGQPTRLLEPAQVPGRPRQLDEAVGDVCVVLEVARNPGVAGPVGTKQPAALVRERAEQELGDLDGGVDVVRRAPSREPAWASAASASPFHAASALSSRSGCGRRSRVLRGAGPRLLGNLAAEHEAVVLERAQPLRMRLAERRPRSPRPST